MMIERIVFRDDLFQQFEEIVESCFHSFNVNFAFRS